LEGIKTKEIWVARDVGHATADSFNQPPALCRAYEGELGTGTL